MNLIGENRKGIMKIPFEMNLGKCGRFEIQKNVVYFLNKAVQKHLHSLMWQVYHVFNKRVEDKTRKSK